MKYDRHSWAHRSISDENTLHNLTSPHLHCVQSTRDKWPISNVPFVWRFCCIVNISLFHLSEYRLELEEQYHAWVKSKFNGVSIYMHRKRNVLSWVKSNYCSAIYIM